MGTLNVLLAARAAGVERIIHTSSSEVYGTALYVPMDEKHPLQGQSPYSASKIGADMLAESFYRSYGLPVTTIRPFNAFGPRQSARAVIPTIITQALNPVPEIALGSIHPKRDYTYVDDTVDGFIKMAEAPGITGEIINIGSGFDISIGDIAQKIITFTGIDKPVTQDPKRVRPINSEVERLYCDNSKARRLLGWEPRVGLDEGLRRTISWIGANPDFFKSGIYNL
jgi:nucleoside-diphosphate-sugar epimerase